MLPEQWTGNNLQWEQWTENKKEARTLHGNTPYPPPHECIDILCFSVMTTCNIAQALYLYPVYVCKQVNNNTEQAQENTLAQWALKTKRQWPRRWAGQISQISRDDTKKRSSTNTWTVTYIFAYITRCLEHVVMNLWLIY